MKTAADHCFYLSTCSIHSLILLVETYLNAKQDKHIRPNQVSFI